jgi:hypothetical protein
VAVLCPYPVRGRSIGTQHIDDLNNVILFSDDAAMKHKSVTSAGVHDTILSQTLRSVSADQRRRVNAVTG